MTGDAEVACSGPDGTVGGGRHKALPTQVTVFWDLAALADTA